MARPAANHEPEVLEFSGPFFWAMSITTGLTTTPKFKSRTPPRTTIRIPSPRAQQGPSIRKQPPVPTPLLCVINGLISSSTRESPPCSCGSPILRLWAVALSAPRPRSARDGQSHVSPAEAAEGHLYRLTGSAECHVSLSLLSVSLGHGRLECKQNFQTNCPQNRLRPQRVDRDSEPQPGRRRPPFRPRSDPEPLTSPFRSFLNPLSIGVNPWRMHRIPQLTVPSQPDR